MKHLIFIVLILVSAAAQADMVAEETTTRTVAKNQNIYTQLCMAALESKYVMEEKARELGVRRSRLRQVTCNDMSPAEFRAKYAQEQLITERSKRTQ